MKQTALKTSSGKLEFTIAHRPRVTKRLHLELDEQGGLVIVAPRHWSRAHISATLSRNTGLVARFLAKARERQLSPLQYIQDEEHLFLGESYPLRILRHSKRKSQVIFSGQALQLSASRLETDAIRSALNAWYRQQALTVFTERMQVIAQKGGKDAGYCTKGIVGCKQGDSAETKKHAAYLGKLFIKGRHQAEHTLDQDAPVDG